MYIKANTVHFLASSLLFLLDMKIRKYEKRSSLNLLTLLRRDGVRYWRVRHLLDVPWRTTHVVNVAKMQNNLASAYCTHVHPMRVYACVLSRKEEMVCRYFDLTSPKMMAQQTRARAPLFPSAFSSSTVCVRQRKPRSTTTATQGHVPDRSNILIPLPKFLVGFWPPSFPTSCIQGLK